MRIFQFTQESGKKITKFESNFVMSRITKTHKETHIGCMHLADGGVVGYHQAVVPQLLLIVSGEGWVRGEAKNTSKCIVARPYSGIKMNGTKPKLKLDSWQL